MHIFVQILGSLLGQILKVKVSQDCQVGAISAIFGTSCPSKLGGITPSSDGLPFDVPFDLMYTHVHLESVHVSWLCFAISFPPLHI